MLSRTRSNPSASWQHSRSSSWRQRIRKSSKRMASNRQRLLETIKINRNRAIKNWALRKPKMHKNAKNNQLWRKQPREFIAIKITFITWKMTIVTSSESTRVHCVRKSTKRRWHTKSSSTTSNMTVRKLWLNAKNAMKKRREVATRSISRARASVIYPKKFKNRKKLCKVKKRKDERNYINSWPTKAFWDTSITTKRMLS